MCSVVWLFAGALLAASPPAETVDSIVQKHVEARGGLERLRSVRTLRAEGRMKIRGRREATFSLAWEKLRRARIELTIQGKANLLVLDGDHGWLVAPGLGMPEPVPLPPEVMGQIVRGVDLEGPLVDYARKGHRVRLLGPHSVEGTSAWELEVTTRDGTTLHVFVDAERFLEIKEVHKESATGLDLETTFSDYKSVDGLLMPHRLTSALRGSLADETTIESIELNASLDEVEFEKPRPGAKKGDP
jgi:hypothetical protein